MNSTNTTDVDQTNLGKAFLVSGSFLAVICPSTVIANVLLLIAIYKDPFNTFRTPTACFLVGLAITDLATGLVPEPLVTSCYFMHHHQHSEVERCEKIFNIAGIIAAITTNSSFLIVMAFTFAQYVAIAFPLKYKRFISVRKTLLCVAGIWLYSTLFEMSQTVGVSKELVEKIDLYIHSTLSLLFTIITYALLQKAFRKQMTARSATLHTTNSVSISTTLELHPRKHRRKSKPMIERNFVRLNLLLIVVLLLCSQPTAILWYIYLYADEDTKNSQTLFVVRVIADNTLYLKFFLDPFLFAWRLPKYRKALRTTLSRRK